MNLNLLLVAGLVVALGFPQTRLQSVPCTSEHEACCCPDERACPCTHDQDDPTPVPAESAPRASTSHVLVEV
ncbi:MAG: hypothetical protein ACOY3Y_16150, partial [Acidobacteriota bacterium]